MTMTTTIGPNMKFTMPEAVRAEVRKVYEGVLGATCMSPRPDLDVFVFGDRQIGIYFGADTLTRAQHRLGVWLELLVDDVEATTKALIEAGVERFEYEDRTHRYFQDQGGLVFRLAGR